ncbi:MAG: hypothetical protein KGZ88_08665, partial [Methylomicrobium sp.]|nr:hypothetical protein [Methylomicrobium sp.]
MKHTYKISALAIALASAFSTVSFADISFVRVKAATLPNFQLTPNIAAAVSSAFGSTPVVRA